MTALFLPEGLSSFLPVISKILIKGIHYFMGLIKFLEDCSTA